jgi:PPOX class probable F420-dependent enzyme
MITATLPTRGRFKRYAKGNRMIDFSSDFGVIAARRLSQEGIVWLTTVRGDRTPQPSPVWFFWDGETFLIYSQPATQKLRNIARSAKVALHLNSDQWGNDVVIVTGDARIDEAAPLVREVPAFVKKYVDDLRSAKSLEDFDRIMDGYTVAIRVTPTGLRGF